MKSYFWNKTWNRKLWPIIHEKWSAVKKIFTIFDSLVISLRRLMMIETYLSLWQLSNPLVGNCDWLLICLNLISDLWIGKKNNFLDSSSRPTDYQKNTNLKGSMIKNILILERMVFFSVAVVISQLMTNAEKNARLVLIVVKSDWWSLG